MDVPRTTACAVACWLLHAPVALAAAPVEEKGRFGEDTPLNLPTDTGKHTAEVGGGGGSLMRTVIGLAVVVAVIYGVAWLLRQAKGAKEERSGGFGLASEAVVALGPNRSVHLIRAGRELVLVGSAEQGVTALRTYTEDEARAVGLLHEGEDLPEVAGPRAAVANPVIANLVETLRKRTAR